MAAACYLCEHPTDGRDDELCPFCREASKVEADLVDGVITQAEYRTKIAGLTVQFDRADDEIFS